MTKGDITKRRALADIIGFAYYFKNKRKLLPQNNS